MIDIQEKKSKIISFLKEAGPSLPVQVARAIEMDPVFASAILSELISSKEVKTSQMKIGSSPLYLIPGDEEKLESKTEHLKPAEKEAQEKLKSKKILLDESESPATRVALRIIKDFAIPFKFEEKISWRYAFAPQEEIEKMLSGEKQAEEKQIETEEMVSKEESETPKAWEVKKEEIKEIKEKQKKAEDIFEKEEASEKKKTKPKTFLNIIENFLEEKSIQIESLEEVDKKKVIAKVKSNEEISLLFAFNKAKITEKELLECYKEAKKQSLPYQIITKSSLTKKLQDTINAYQSLLATYQLE